MEAKCINCNERSNLSQIGMCTDHKICSNCLENLHNLNKKNLKSCKRCKSFFFEEKKFFFRSERCSYCKSSVDLNQICNAHYPCKNCIITKLCNKNFAIKNCYKCFTLRDHSCKSCFTIISQNQEIINPACSSHIYCLNCFSLMPKKIISPCEKCNLFFEPPINNKCIMCKNDENINMICDNRHYLCISCISLITKTNTNSAIIIEKLNCANCKNILSSTDLRNLINIPRKASPMPEEKKLTFSSGTSTTILSVNAKSINPKSTVASSSYSMSSSLSIDVNSKKNIQKTSPRAGIFLECNHSCSKENLIEKFKYFLKDFINLLHEKNIEKLNEQTYSLGCIYNSCYNTGCMSFSWFQEPADEMLRKYNVSYSFKERYALYFEGIRMKFVICKHCGNAYGYIVFNKCVVCKNDN